MAMEEENDFFISYNHRDSEWAEWIAWELEEAGYRVCIQAWDFSAGENFVIAMDKGLKTARRLIAVISPNYVTSNFTPPEWAAFFRKDPGGVESRLIPVRVQEVELDGLLSQIIYIDLENRHVSERGIQKA
jgi:hypothetical protein